MSLFYVNCCIILVIRNSGKALPSTAGSLGLGFMSRTVLHVQKKKVVPLTAFALCDLKANYKILLPCYSENGSIGELFLSFLSF